ncbi:MAG: coenzyme F420-0:L-glutamate ligase [Candidatus Staskawiczbacteria bacterium]|nr:coenzyme F420-0:L-glutamate ligase [Candidatus Staskawiczbacteria bacterium]
METDQFLQPNKGKQLIINVNGESFARYPIKTRVVMPGEDLIKLVKEYVIPYTKSDDIIFISEKMVAITQKRSIPIKDIKPSWLAKNAVRFVYKNPGGLGIATPWTMQMVIEEAGLPRFLFSAIVAVITKFLGIKGMFYRLIGQRAKAIDGPIPHAMPPYNECVTLSPLNPEEIAKQIKKTFGYETVIIDANDLGVETMGISSNKIEDSWASAIFKDNPLGQGREQTPLCIVRKILH